MSMYQLQNNNMVVEHIDKKTKRFTTVDDEEYQEWLKQGNVPLGKDEKVIILSEEEKRIRDLELYILMKEGLI